MKFFGGSKISLTLLGFVVVLLVGSGSAKPDWRGFYFNDFEGIVGAEWSSIKTDWTPAGARRFLGQFGDENVTLTLRDLPAHTEVTVSFELFILRSWDGNNQTHGPDVWQLKVDRGPTLLHTTFANVPPDIKDFNQAYPGDYPGGDYLPYTGAAEIKTLGYTEIPSPAPDSVYRLSYTFAHTASILGLDFSGQGLQGIQDESWGLDNVTVETSLAVDFNGDGKVDAEDLMILIEHWGQDEPLVDIAPPPFGDGIVDMKDLEVFMSHWPVVVPEEVVYIQWLGHSSVKIWTEDCVVYVDPERLTESLHDATLVCVTHSHGDHYSPSDIARVSNPQTLFIAPPDVVQQYGSGQAIAPGQTIEFDNVNIIAVPAYNTNKPNHPKSRNWVGYIIEIGSKRIYVAGDTDLIEEMNTLGDIDAAILPAGGTYTMNAVEAAEATQYIQPELAIPYHWGRNVGTLSDAKTFAQEAACAVKILTVGETISSEDWPKYSPLIAHWELDETEGGIAYDSSGDNDGSCYGEPLWQPNSGKVNGALQLDGIDDYISTGFILDPAEGVFSIFAWVKGGAAGQVIISQTDGTGAGETWIGAEASDGKLMTGLVPPPVGRSAPQPLVSESVITDGQWHHLGLVWERSYRYLYVDGIEAAKDTKALAPLKSSDGGLYIGAGKTLDAASFFPGLIDDVRIYNRALSTKDIEELAG